jgi:hypothetical protein
VRLALLPANIEIGARTQAHSLVPIQFEFGISSEGKIKMAVAYLPYAGCKSV